VVRSALLCQFQHLVEPRRSKAVDKGGQRHLAESVRNFGGAGHQPTLLHCCAERGGAGRGEADIRGRSQSTNKAINNIEMKRYTSRDWNFALDIPARWNAFPAVSVAIIKKVYKHHLPGNFDAVLDAANAFGRTTGGRRETRTPDIRCVKPTL
jgi:hypothetical protein